MIVMARLVCFLALFISSTIAFGAEALNDGQLVSQQIFAEALKKANAGDRQAMEFLAFSYEYGVGTEQNESEAIRWLERAAAQGEVVPGIRTAC
jgi:TPR repeat protein